MSRAFVVGRGGFLGLAALAVVAMLFAVACGSDDKDDSATPTEPAGGIAVTDAWARPSANNVGAAYLVIRNTGTAEDRLLSASSPVSPKVQVHEVVTSGLTQQMQEVSDGIVVPAGGSAELNPGGYHIMLMDLAEPFAVGQMVPLSLEFEQAGRIEVHAQVREADALGGEHGGHG